MKHAHYQKNVSHLQSIDVYRVCQLFDVTDPCIQHAVKKLLCAGQRGAKTQAQDVQEAIDTLARYQGMQLEDSSQPQPAKPARAEELQADDGWIEWRGGDCPAERLTRRIDLRFGNGAEIFGTDRNWIWTHNDIEQQYRITHYRLAKGQA